ncbi:hypothetical protein ACFPVY_13840, partial [Flavobacterium qiangtangense]
MRSKILLLLLNLLFLSTLSAQNVAVKNNSKKPVGSAGRGILAVLSADYSAVNSSCPSANNGSVIVYGEGGITPYVSYSIAGSATQTNTTGVFTSLAPGTYDVSVTDSNGDVATRTGIVISEIPNIAISPVTGNVCLGSSTLLTASGASTYNWSSVPVDPSLNTSNVGAVQSVSPTQQTVYTATSTVPATNLVFNGDFSLGNLGFISNYTYANPTSGSLATGDYGVVTNPNTWFTGFTNCVDHTTGTGSQLVVNGSLTSATNNTIWEQHIAVGAAQNYTFSYWLQSVSAASPSVVSVFINGVLQGVASPTATACGWTQYTYTWNSVANTLANIQIIENGGGDFAIDDISFIGNSSCSLTASSTISVNPAPTATISGTAKMCVDAGNSPVVTFVGANGTPPYTFSYNINGGATQTVASLPGSSSVTVPVNTTAPGTFVYNLVNISDSSNPNCSQAATGSATITVIARATAAFTGNASICPNTTSILSFTGTPGATVIFKSSDGSFFTVVIGANGTATFTPPTVAVTTVYTLVLVNSNPAGCSSEISGTVTFTVNRTGCASVLAGDVNLSDVAAICNVGDTRDLSASYQEIGATTQYTVASIPYCPPFPFTGGIQMPITSDDDYTASFDLPFDFCFYGQSYDFVRVGDNGVITFGLPYTTVYGANCPYILNGTVPNTGFNIRNAIYGIFTDMETTNNPGPNTVINYQVLGSYPCRAFVVSFNEVPAYGGACTDPQYRTTSQIVMYEISNIIDVYVQKRTPCMGWESGRGLIGIQNAAGTLASVPPGRNTGAWTATNEAWRFTPSGTSIVNFSWLDENGAVISNNTNITVAPTQTTTYTAQAVYQTCANTSVVTTKAVTIEVFEDRSLEPENLLNCNNAPFDLTQNTATVLAGLPDASEFYISYYSNAIDAQNQVSPITTPQAYNIVGQTQTIYMTIIDPNSCVRVKPFTITSVIPVPDSPDDVSECGSYVLPALNSGNYFSGPNGTGTPYFANDVIDESILMYIFVQAPNSNCSAENSFQITISDPPATVTPSDFHVCDDNFDGFAEFILSEKNDEITGGNATYAVTYYLTQADAENSDNEITSVPFQNTVANTQIIYVRVQNASDDPNTDCYTLGTLTLVVDPKPEILSDIPDYVLCDENTPGDQTEIFDLTTKYDEIVADQTGLDISFYTTEALAIAGDSPIAPANAYSAGPQETIWIRVTDTATECFSVSSFNLVVNPLPTIAPVETYFVCSIPSDQNVGEFDLSTQSDDISGNATNVTVTYYYTAAEAIAADPLTALPLLYTSDGNNPQTIYVNVKDNTTNCFSLTTLQLGVVSSPDAVTPTALEVCDDNNDGFAAFNLSLKTGEITGGDTTLVVT